MKLSCVQQKLNKGLTLAGRLVGSKMTLPVLNNVLLKAGKGKLTIISTDLETAIIAKIGAKVESEGKITVPSRLLSDFVAANKDKKINIVLNEKLTLALKSKHSKAHIKGIDAREFPLIPQVKEAPLLNMDSIALQKGLNQVVIAAATDDTRPNLCGVLFKIKDGKLKIVATDSYRLAEKTITLKQAEREKREFIVPLKAVHEMLRVLSMTDPTTVSIKANENQVGLTLPGVEIVSRLVEGEFPEYEQIIPERYDTKTSLNSNEFSGLVKIASVFAREAANNVQLNFDKKGEIALNATSDQVGDNRSRLQTQVVGKDNKIAFNAKYISDVLSVLGDQEINLEMTGSHNPGLIKPKQDKGYLYVIMPLKMEQE